MAETDVHESSSSLREVGCCPAHTNAQCTGIHLCIISLFSKKVQYLSSTVDVVRVSLLTFQQSDMGEVFHWIGQSQKNLALLVRYKGRVHSLGTNYTKKSSFALSALLYRTDLRLPSVAFKTMLHYLHEDLQNIPLI